ncbi:unnamed protein product [Lactuca saligna]|uniref:Uncharacterized protein n=1 Tax=Lactuca saligna TaxID=75948 RepID=A0AA36E5J4_LACSI|nr:unnamed protein product [Lactuca saligna]
MVMVSRDLWWLMGFHSSGAGGQRWQHCCFCFPAPTGLTREKENERVVGGGLIGDGWRVDGCGRSDVPVVPGGFPVASLSVVLSHPRWWCFSTAVGSSPTAPLLGFPASVNRKEGRSGDAAWHQLGGGCGWSLVAASHSPRGRMEAGDVCSNNGGSIEWWPTVVVWVARK